MSNTNPNDPRAYPLLAKVLDTPSLLGLADRSSLLEAFQRSVATAITLPCGEARQDLLRVLNGAVSDACHRRDYYRDKQILVEQLRASYPQASEIRDTAQAIQAILQTILDSADDVSHKAQEHAIALNSMGWPSFREELDRLTGIIVHRIKQLERSDGILPVAEKVDDSGLGPIVINKEVYQ